MEVIYKVCGKCKTTKKASDFYLIKGELSCYCRPCKKAHDTEYYHRRGGRERIKQNRLNNIANIRKSEKAWRDKNPEYGKGKLLQRYWPDKTWKECLIEFRNLVLLQNNKCKICKKPETRPSKVGSTKIIRDLCVDHNHATGKVRGLLCDACNVLLGLANDSPEVCLEAARYLKESA